MGIMTSLFGDKNHRPPALPSIISILEHCSENYNQPHNVNQSFKQVLPNQTKNSSALHQCLYWDLESLFHLV